MNVKSKKSGGLGYTIVEVMIFLAVSGFMFVVAAAFINGKQAQETFHRGMDEIGANLSSLIDSVANGEFDLPATGFSCSATSSGPPNISGLSGQGQGGNSGCTFLGTVLSLGQVTDAPQTFDTYTVVARQFAPTPSPPGCPAVFGYNMPVQSFCQAEPKTAASLKTSGKWGYGMNLKSVYLCSDLTCSSRSAVDGVGVFSSFGSASVSGVRGTGAQTVGIVSFSNLSVGNVVSNISSLSSARTNAPSGSPNVLSNGQYILLCFESGDKIGNVTIGGTSSQLSSVSVSYNKGSYDKGACD